MDKIDKEIWERYENKRNNSTVHFELSLSRLGEEEIEKVKKLKKILFEEINPGGTNTLRINLLELKF